MSDETMLMETPQSLTDVYCTKQDCMFHVIVTQDIIDRYSVVDEVSGSETNTITVDKFIYCQLLHTRYYLDASLLPIKCSLMVSKAEYAQQIQVQQAAIQAAKAGGIANKVITPNFKRR